MRRPNGGGTSQVFSLCSNSTNKVCQVEYGDDYCKAGTEFVERSWPVNQCEGNDELMLFSDWCIESDRHHNDFKIPMALSSVYGNEVVCQADVLAQDYLLPDDQMLCQSAGIEFVNGTVSKGSRMNYCDGNSLKVKYFADQSCATSDKDDVMKISTLTEYSEDCTENLATGFIVRSNCATPRFFCKDLYHTVFSKKVAEEHVPVPSPPSPKPALDLYISEENYFLNSTGRNSDRCCTCDEVPDCFLFRQLYLQGECTSRSNGESWSLNNGGEDAICRLMFSDNNCETVSNPCSALYEPDKCYDIGTRLTKLQDWCVEEKDDFTGEYSIPLVRSQQYIDVQSCEAGTGFLRERTVLVDPNYCQRGHVTINGTKQQGSFMNYCDENDVLQVKVFSDMRCSEQAEGMQVTEVEISSECGIFGDGISRKASCGDPMAYCKNLYSLQYLGFELESTEERSSSVNPSISPSSLVSITPKQGDEESVQPTNKSHSMSSSAVVSMAYNRYESISWVWMLSLSLLTLGLGMNNIY